VQCISCLYSFTLAKPHDLQAEEEQDKVEALLVASGYDANAAREGGV